MNHSTMTIQTMFISLYFSDNSFVDMHFCFVTTLTMLKSIFLRKANKRKYNK